MNSLHVVYVEILIICIIIISQIIFFLKSKKQIKTLALFFPNLNLIKINQNEIIYINNDDEENTTFKDILKAINVYLIKNKGATTDFNIIKDIVERSIYLEEEDISHTLTIPLYFGLIGTMVGIVFGLVNLQSVSNLSINFDISPFLNCVLIAMTSSLLGLSFTVSNSNFSYKKTKKILENRKNEFYILLQTELLPVFNQNISNSINGLHSTLVKFNEIFTGNLNNLSNILNKNHDALIAQENILNALESIDITEYAKANVKVLRELNAGTEQLVKFNKYLNNLNYLVDCTSRLSASFEDLLTRSNNFHGLAEKLDSRVEESNKLIQFLNDHFAHLEKRGEIIKESIVKVEDVMIKSLNQLSEHTETKIEAIKQITIKEEDLMTRAFAENSNHFSKLSLLEDLKKSIEPLGPSVLEIKNAIESLKISIESSNSVLKEIKEIGVIRRTQNITHSIKKLFNFKKLFVSK